MAVWNPSWMATATPRASASSQNGLVDRVGEGSAAARVGPHEGGDEPEFVASPPQLGDGGGGVLERHHGRSRATGSVQRRSSPPASRCRPGRGRRPPSDPCSPRSRIRSSGTRRRRRCPRHPCRPAGRRGRRRPAVPVPAAPGRRARRHRCPVSPSVPSRATKMSWSPTITWSRPCSSVTMRGRRSSGIDAHAARGSSTCPSASIVRGRSAMPRTYRSDLRT